MRNKIIIISVCSLFLLSGCSFMASRIIPLNDIKEPTGLYNVGTQIFEWIDEDRDEWFTEQEGDKRKLVVQVWYPSLDKGEKADPWVDYSPHRIEAIIDEYKIPRFIARSIDRINTNSYFDLSPAKDDYFPIIIFSHGFEGWRSQNTTQIQELVSHGYVVFSVDHTHDALITIFEDGTFVKSAKKYCKGCDPEEFYKVFNPQINTRIEDVRFVIDQIEKMQKNKIESDIFSIMDTDKIGVFGHSFGGGTSLAVTILDERIKSCISLDGWYTPVHPDIYSRGLTRPFLLLGQIEWDKKINYEILDNILSLENEVSYKLSLNGAEHYDFTDSPHLSNLTSKFNLSSELESKEILEVTNTTVLGFFDSHLKLKSSDWIEKINNNNNIIFEKFNANE